MKRYAPNTEPFVSTPSICTCYESCTASVTGTWNWMLKCFFLFKIISCTIIIIIMEQEFIFLWKEIFFLKSGSCDWYRVNLFNIKKGKVHCIALKSCTILWKSIVQSTGMFQGQFCQQTFHKKFLFMNTWIQWEAL